MTLGDAFKKVNSQGQDAFNNARARMMKEKEAHDRQLEMRDVDRVKHEISTKRLEHQKILSEVERMRRDLVRLKYGFKDNHTLVLIRNMESQIRTMESEARIVDQDIRMKTLEAQRHGGLSY